VIRIRYEDPSAGLHAKAVRSGRHRRGGARTTVYLLPGLTGTQRKAALRRLRREASRGYGPPVPLPQLLAALGADRTRRTLRIATGVIRRHPPVSLVPAMVTGVLMALFLLASISVRTMHLPAGGGSLAPEAAGPFTGLPPGSSAPVSRPRAGGSRSRGSGAHGSPRKSPARGSSALPGGGGTGLGAGEPITTGASSAGAGSAVSAAAGGVSGPSAASGSTVAATGSGGSTRPKPILGRDSPDISLPR